MLIFYFLKFAEIIFFDHHKNFFRIFDYLKDVFFSTIWENSHQKSAGPLPLGISNIDGKFHKPHFK